MRQSACVLFRRNLAYDLPYDTILVLLALTTVYLRSL